MLGFFELIELGGTIEKQLVHNDVKKDNVLTLVINKELFSKIDEDIYYRQFPDSTDFKPSENEITINFEFLKIKLLKESE